MRYILIILALFDYLGPTYLIHVVYTLTLKNKNFLQKLGIQRSSLYH